MGQMLQTYFINIFSNHPQLEMLLRYTLTAPKLLEPFIWQLPNYEARMFHLYAGYPTFT